MPTLGSLFDGIGGFPLAAVRNGIEPVWASEIEAFPIEVTRKRFPSMLHVGDITKLNGAELPPVDIITGGSPCQDLSVAGARAGLAGERSGLFMEQIRVVKEMRDADKRRGRTAHTVRPRYMCWENVPGAFSSAGGEDFRIVLEEIVRIKDGSCSVPRPDSGRWESAGAIVLGNQFSLAWRVMDAQFWGVAQRRKRIFLVADFAGRSAIQILFEQDRLPGYPASGGGPGQGTPASAPGSPASPGRAGPIGFDGYNGDLTGEKAATLGVNCGMSTGRNGVITAFAANQRDEVRDLHDVAAALAAQPGMKQQTFVAGITAKGNGDCFLSEERHTSLSGGGGMPGQGYPAIFTAGFSAGQGSAAGGIGFQTECSPTLKASESGSNMVPSILCLNDQGGSVMACSEDVAGTLRAQEHGHQPLIVDKRSDEMMPALYENHGIDARYTGPHTVAPTMSARYGTGGNNVPLIAQGSEPCQESSHAMFSRQRVDVFREDAVASTQSARQHKDATDLVMDVAGLDCRNGRENGDLCGTLQQGTTGSSLNSIHPVRTGRLIRRLTPLECERLQGFPDHWTELPDASDSARYKALGNSVAIPCVDFVLRGIAYFLRWKEESHP
ncbi:MAG TPA: DNA cytosine methyltransferase [Clostridiales bacterium]|nr:DNA cytosine methyltransferase [Clostridiales bacterium]